MLKMNVAINLWDDFLNEKRIERLNKNDDDIAYFVTSSDKDNDHKTGEFYMIQYTASNDGDGIQRGFLIVNNMVSNIGFYSRIKSIQFERDDLIKTKDADEIMRIHYIIRNSDNTDDMHLYFTVNRFK